MSKSRIADKVNIENIHFERNVRAHEDKAVVTYAASSKCLHFNPKMTKLLNIRDWTDVIVGYDRRSEIIILKRCDPSEFGSVAVRAPIRKDGGNPERIKHTRGIGLGNVANALRLTTRTVYRAERDGEMIFLEKLED